MKTRVISGAVMVAVFAAVLAASTKYPVVMFVAAAILAAIAVYEALYATGIVKNKVITAVGAVFAILFILRLLIINLLPSKYLSFIDISNSSVIPYILLGIFGNVSSFIAVFALIQFALYLKFHKDIKLEGMLGMILLPVVIAYAFMSFATLAVYGSNLFFVVLIFCWSAIADTGAYFTGVALGKHKMAPIISPKKSWEGLVGGIVSSLFVTLGVCVLYNNAFDFKVNTATVLLITPIFVLIGVLGDLTASLIKRKCEIKDFGKLIPGHGGVLDRFDSILMISVAFSALLESISYMPSLLFF